jgi:superfamily II DNA or RNA helicase
MVIHAPIFVQILDLMMHFGDTFSMRRFSLVVVDECHYAAGNHAYKHIMTKFYHTLSLSERPHIIGLTASPLLNLKETHSEEQLTKMLDNLEHTLDAKLICASGLLSGEIPGFLSKTIQEQRIEYRSARGRAIPSADNLKLLPSRFREFKQLEHLYKDLGPLVLSIYCKVLQRELSRNVFECESMRQFEEALEHLNRIIAFCDKEVHILPSKVREGKDWAAYFVSLL